MLTFTFDGERPLSFPCRRSQGGQKKKEGKNKKGRREEG